MSVDPRNIENPTLVGTPLRDAAVDPEPGDFLPPVNAGLEGEEGNPHGPNVYAPGIHGEQGIRPVRPGAVAADGATQSTEESQHATQWQGGTDPEPDPVPEEGTP